MVHHLLTPPQHRSALAALAVAALLATLLGGTGRPAPAHAQDPPSSDATLSGLELANATSGSTAPVGLREESYTLADVQYYNAVVLKEVTSVTVKPTATAGGVATISVQLQGGPAAQTVASGATSSAITITPKSDDTVPHVITVNVTAEDGATTKEHRISIWQLPPVSFDSATVDDMHFTAGAGVPFDSGTQMSTIVLPAANVVSSTEVTYSATGLPAGLSLGGAREILGTPESATSGPVTVTYTATAAEIGSSASLTFQVTVHSAVVFDDDELRAFNRAYGLPLTRGEIQADLLRAAFEYTVGQQTPISVTLPSASGGYGQLTYRLITFVGTEERSFNEHVAGFSFDPTTRLLTSDTGGSAPSAAKLYTVKYSAVDENGASADARQRIIVREAPSLPAIADKNLTVGAHASIALPQASGGSLGRGENPPYTLSPEIEGLSFDRDRGLTLSGTPETPGSTVMTYTVTDTNGVSASQTFTITVNNGPTAPTSAPASVRGGQATTVAANNGFAFTAAVFWDAVSGATGYVVQVVEASGSYPDKPVSAVPAGAVLSFRTTPLHAVVSQIRTGDYKVRVAARNSDGVGPWSADVRFTVRMGGM